MKTTKKTKKPVFKPMFVIDLTDGKDAEEMYEEILQNKYDNKLPMTTYEIGKFAEYKIVQALDSFIDDLFDGHNAVVIDNCEFKAFDAIKVTIKEPWYKRFWNWLRGRK